MNKVTNRILKKWSILLNSMLIYMLTSNIILQEYICFIYAICLHNLMYNMFYVLHIFRYVYVIYVWHIDT